jgi:hypothetical protein
MYSSLTDIQIIWHIHTTSPTARSNSNTEE